MIPMLRTLHEWGVRKSRRLCAGGNVWWERLRTTRAALALEDELSLAYLIGHQLDHITVLRQKKKYSGLPLRLVALLRFLATHSRPGVDQATPHKYLFHAITHNQFEALRTAAAALPKEDVEFLVDPEIRMKMQEDQGATGVLFFQGSDLLIGAILFLQRAPALYLRLLADGRREVIDNHFNALCLAHFFLPAFLRTLQETECRYVIVSNDHTVGNRSMRLAAEVLHRKTVYLQHASVSRLFPALQYDCAFLDGQASLEIYDRTEPVARTRPFMPVDGKMTVVLSGQKKALSHRASPPAEPAIGVAVNLLDDLALVLEFLEKMTVFRIPVIVRTHPAQTAAFLNALGELSKRHSWVTTVRATDQPLSDFFQSLSLLVAGNTSIHLEATLAGVPSYYHLFSTDTEHHDYYGYLSHGLIHPFPMEDLVTHRVEIGSLFGRSPEPAVVQYYSSTYGTLWEGQEGALVADCLKKLATGGPPALSLRLLSEDDRFRVFTPAADPGSSREET